MVDLHGPHSGYHRLQNPLSACAKFPRMVLSWVPRSFPDSSPRVLHDPPQDWVHELLFPGVWVNPPPSASGSQKNKVRKKYMLGLAEMLHLCWDHFFPLKT